MTKSGIDPLAIGTEIRLGRMARENAATKALRLLVSGRVMIMHCEPLSVRAQVRGDSGVVRRVVFSPRTGWACDCRGRGDRCSHVLAVKSVVVVERGPYE